MNIVITLKLSQLDTLIEVLQDQIIPVQTTIADKCMYYLHQIMLKKLLKKQIDKHHDCNGKHFKITLNYTEATALYLAIDKVKLTNNVYIGNVIRTLKNNLHQRLMA